MPLKVFIPVASRLFIFNFVIIINIDLQSLLLEMGFTTVIQNKPAGTPAEKALPSNVNVMNYLKLVIPKMFQVCEILLSIDTDTYNFKIFFISCT